MLRHAFAMVVVLVLACGSYGQQAPASAPAQLLEKQPYVLGPAQLQEFPEQSYFYVATEATQKSMPEVMRKLMPQLMEAAKTAGVEPGTGPVVIVFTGVTQDPDAPFEAEAGFIVPETVKPAGDAQVRKLEAMKCATVLYTGGMPNVGKAYEALFGSIMASGKVPTMEIRQMMLYWEGEGSNNNISLMMAGLQ